ncbi:MAG: hypothetical protein ACYC9N_13855 [Thermoanaerobaculia bacterium]
MGRRTTLRPKQKEQASGPSAFFMIVLAIALGLLGWAFVTTLRKSPKTPRETKPPTKAHDPRPPQHGEMVDLSSAFEI